MENEIEYNDEYDDERSDERAYELAKELAIQYAKELANKSEITEAVKHWKPILKKAKINGQRVAFDVRWVDPSLILEVLGNPDYKVYFC